MKKILAIIALLSATTVWAELKVGTVDMLLLVRNHADYGRNKTLLQQTDKDYQRKMDLIKADLEKVQEEGKKISDQLRNPMLAVTVKQKLEKDMIDIQNRFFAGQQKLRSEMMRSQQELQALEGRLLKTTTDDINNRIAKFADANGYDMIIDGSAVRFSKKSFDVTDSILKEMGVDPAKAKKIDESK